MLFRSILIAVIKPLIDIIKIGVDVIKGFFDNIYDTATEFISSFGDGIINILNTVGGFLMDGFKGLWDIIKSPFVAVYDWITGWVKAIGDWFKSSWLGKKIFGDSGDSSSSTPVLSSKSDGSGSEAMQASAQASASRQAESTRAQKDTSEDLKRLVDVNVAQAQQMEKVASNTGQTKEAVERNGTTY